jgi:FtsP/CotA-like multicopper oxidase with cupredoxin domain
MQRRTFLKGSLAALGLTALASYGVLQKAGLSYADPLKGFTTSLPIPPLLDDLSSIDGESSFALRVQRGSRSFFPDHETPTMGYNGDYLGPTIKIRNGQRVKLKVQNDLNERTTVHWHGLHVPAKWDGGPRQVIKAGDDWLPEFTIDQPAATLWYHPHAMGLTGEQVYQGLAGLFIIEDEVSSALEIPMTYGIDDFPLVLQDRRFHRDGSFAYARSMMDIMHGVIGNYLLVNGALWPNLAVPQGKVRLRILNGSNSSIYRIGFADERTFYQIATDGGFQEQPVALKSLFLSAGERAEIIVDFQEDPLGSKTSLLVDQQTGYRFEAMQFTVDSPSDKKYTIPSALTHIDWIPEQEAVKSRRFAMETMSMGRGKMGMGMMGRGMMGGRLTINGKNMDINRIDERIKLGTTEIWEISNHSAMMMSLPHSMHLHDVQFQILDRNGTPPPAYERGRKDTVLIPPGEKVRIIARFEDYTGVYMYHCHLLEHEDNGMMGQFEVVA